MKLTIPSPKNLKRREAFLLTHKDYYPESKREAELLKIAHTRAEKKLRWEMPEVRLETQQERMKETAKTFTPVAKKQGLFARVRNIFKSQRGS